jgi:Protein of unknown function (DUF732)
MATIALMAEPGRAAHETGAETVAQDVGKTAAVPNSTPTDAVELAWSDNSDRNDGADGPGEDIPNEPTAVRQSWRATWRIAGALVVAGLVLAGAIVVGRWALTTTQSPTKAAKPPAPTASAPPAPPLATATAPSSIASTPDQDDKYIQALNDKGISFANPGAAIYNGKTVCQNIGQGMTVQEVVAAFRASSPAFSANANDFVAISVRAYCPQHSNLVAGF